uniref:FH2 domain-containing protein 1-like n=1 Tax=Stegastes partitus TaxID=144197 RepID=A0A3B5BBZ9_9TELE
MNSPSVNGLVLRLLVSSVFAWQAAIQSIDGDTGRNVQRRSMKKLNWDTIPSQRVLGKLNVWTSSRPQRDLVLDIRSMEELFSHVDKRASLRNSKVAPKKCDGMDNFPQEPQVTILDSKRSMNIGILLRHFKSGNLSVLPEADQFMVQLVKVPGYEERLKTMVLREEFFPLMEDVKNSVAVMTKAANELLDCDDLHSVIRLVLKAGNYMNAGGHSANAIGFRMTSLLKLADTKANKPGMNLVHYVAKQVEDIDTELLTFPSQLDHIGMASRICKDEVITDFEREVKKIKEVKLYSSRQPGLLKQMETFLLAKIADLESSLLELTALSNAVAEYFCEDPATFKLEECCSIFHSFCKRFETAVQENREREAAEQRRHRKESVRVAGKRRSTLSSAGSEPKSDSSCLESALHSFLSTEGLARSRKNTLPPIEGSPSERTSQAAPLFKKAEGTSPSSRESPGKKQAKLQKEDKEMTRVENNKEAEKTREISRKVLRYQSSLDGDRASGTPRRSEREQDKPAVPCTPRPRTRDFFFADNGDVGSPWTILSPFPCPRKNKPQTQRKSHQRRLSSTYGGDDHGDGVWETDEGCHRPNSSNQNSVTSAGSTSLPECVRQRTLSQGPILRSASVDETRQSPASGFRLGDLFPRICSGLSSKAGNHIEGQASTSGFISFFRRIGGKSKPGDLEEQKF